MSKQRNSTKDNTLLFIKNAIEQKRISRSEIESMTKINYPLFSFRYFNDISMRDCKEPQFFVDYINRLKKLSQLGWDEIRKSHTHSFGMEPIPVFQIKHQGLLPSFVTKEVDLHLFRAVGDNRVMAGLQDGKLYHVFFVEAKFGDVSPH